jgi:hypothetical protein
VSIKDCVILALMVRFDLYGAHVGFMVLGKPSSLVILYRTAPPCFKVVCWRENEVAQDDGRAGHHWESRLHPGSRGPILT